MRTNGLALVGALSVGLTLGGANAAAGQAGPKGVVFFETNIRPVLAKHCYECHSTEADELEAGLRLDTRKGMREGGSSGTPAVAPGKPDESLLLKAIRHNNPDLEMPPDDPLPADVVADFEKWIAAGAPDPRDGSKPDAADKPGKLWAYDPPRKTRPPEVNNADWPRNGIDRFILRKLETEGLEPVEEADRQTLIRRLYFDLIGLPPEPEAVERFVNSEDPRAYEKLVDRLLDSPRFGERWGRHWLDVARYAESTGKEWNWAHPHAWRYRDYVIESFNEDKPYDRFLKEQLAGDKMEADSDAERTEQRTATGFLAIGPKSVSIGNDNRFEMELVDEQIDAMGQSMLGLTVSCARCHDHKFDPISQEDYYGLAGIFFSTRTLFGTSNDGYKGRNNRQGRELLPVGPDADQRYKARKQHEKELGKLSKKLNEAEKKLKKLKNNGPKKKVQAHQKEVDRLKQKRVELKNNTLPKPDWSMGVRDEDNPGDTKLRENGEFNSRGDKVPRGFIRRLTDDNPPEIPGDQSGRMALAEWIASQDHPLTARVFVNRVWHHLFGRGIVKTVDNFGVLGKRPTHPELLDWLAIRFMKKQGWSVKKLIRSIVLSRAYRLSTHYNERNKQADPQNKLVWRMSPRRLDVESLRDAMLAISGQLDTRPLQGSPAVQQLKPGWITKRVASDNYREKVEHNHRSVYLPIVRDAVPQMLETFDFARPTLVEGARPQSTVPGQALFMLNDDFVVEHSEHLARRLLDEAASGEAKRIDRAYHLALARSPTEAERRRALSYIERAEGLADGKNSKQKRLRAWASFCQALLGSGEFRYLISAGGGTTAAPSGEADAS